MSSTSHRPVRRKHGRATVVTAAFAAALAGTVTFTAVAGAAGPKPVVTDPGGTGTGPAGSNHGMNAPLGQGQAHADEPDLSHRGGTFTPSVSASYLHGPDVASYQHPGGRAVDWTAVRAGGSTFAIIKATEGDGYTNPYFPADWAAAAGAGLVRGAYAYARPSTQPGSAAAQAAYLVRFVGSTHAARTLAPFLDLEETGGLSPAALVAWTASFLYTIETATGRTPYVYSYRSFIQTQLADSAAFRPYPLWFASYTGAPTPGVIPGGWSTWRFWQYTSSATSPGIAGNVDMSVFCCAAATLADTADGRTEIARRYRIDARARSLVGTTTGAEGPAAGGGRWQPFRNGGMTWSVGTGARLVYGGIGYKYLQLGGSRFVIGLPTSDEMDAPGGGRQQTYQRGRIYSRVGAGTHEVHGAILGRYLQLGGSASYLGAPVSDEHAAPGGRQSDFVHGSLRFTGGAVIRLP